ncbi:ATP-binding protein [Aureisphaera galaxeae]|uniref:sensor histidine kinase n=1 Tax=Aureisphaera galaxeae TaxID=1538023 RepID=UPI002350B1FB|nr:ATP-binding protein [Aureisphaera galaxeae]MDC8004902.1 ATP-binding protein [Aureisphaera galaxeae]
MEPNATAELIVFISILLVAGLFLVLLFVIFIRRKNVLIRKSQEEKEAFERELAEAQIEIREETLRNISWELHDNIGQVMTLAKVKAQNAGDNPEKMKQAARLIGDGLDELRALSKMINPETIRKLSLRESVQMEIDRFNRMRFIDASLTIHGEVVDVNVKDQSILFRILQEFFSNTIKHSQATELKVDMYFKGENLIIKASDNGVGFNDSESFTGIGLKNMASRAKLIKTDFSIQSEENVGTTLTLEYPLTKNQV